MPPASQPYAIVDLGEAVALLTLGFNLIEMQPSTNGKYKVFFFEEHLEASEEKNIKSVVDEYQRKKLQVDAQSFYRSMKEIKNRIYDYDEQRAASRT